MSRVRTLPLTFAVAALVAAGCSSSESSTATTPAAGTVPPTAAPPSTAPPTTAPATTAPPATEAPPETAPPETASPTIAPTIAPTTTSPADEPDGPLAIDQALARQALLTIDDFPEGWVAEPHEENPDDDPDPAVQEQFDICLGTGPDSVADQLDGREVNSPDFSSEIEGLSVEQEALMADDEAMAIAAMEEVGVDGAAECMQDVLQTYFASEFELDSSDFPPGTTLGQITVERVPNTIDPTVAVEYLVTVPFEFEGEALEVFLDVVYFRQGRALSQVQFQSVGAPFDPEGIGFLGGEILDRLFVIGS